MTRKRLDPVWRQHQFSHAVKTKRLLTVSPTKSSSCPVFPYDRFKRSPLARDVGRSLTSEPLYLATVTVCCRWLKSLSRRKASVGSVGFQCLTSQSAACGVGVRFSRGCDSASNSGRGHRKCRANDSNFFFLSQNPNHTVPLLVDPCNCQEPTVDVSGLLDPQQSGTVLGWNVLSCIGVPSRAPLPCVGEGMGFSRNLKNLFDF